MLCAKAVTVPSSDIEPVIQELRRALQEHARFVRSLAVKSLMLAPEDTPSETSLLNSQDPAAEAVATTSSTSTRQSTTPPPQSLRTPSSSCN
jgi:hypothetical protein